MSCSASHPRGTAMGNAAVLRSNSAHAKPASTAGEHKSDVPTKTSFQTTQASPLPAHTTPRTY